MAVIGYIRVSSRRQTCEHQRFEIEQFAEYNHIRVNEWITETISSRQPLEKRKLGEVLLSLAPDDILISTEISRLGRSLLEILRILEYCLSKNCQIWTIKENYHLGNDIQSKVMAFAFGLSAEIERNLISERTRASLDDMRARGIKLGRPFSAQTKKLKLARNIHRIRRMLGKGWTRYRIAKALNVSPATVFRFVRRMKLECGDIVEI